MKIESKSWQRFEGKIRNLKQYLQLLDLSLKNSNHQCNKRKEEKIDIRIVLGSKEDSHAQLNIPNQEKDINRVFSTARKLLNEQAFIELHCIFSDYVANIIAEIAHGDPKRLLNILGKDNGKSICFSDLIKLGSYDEIINEMARRVFRILENMRSTKDMMQKLIKITDISVDEKLLQNALVFIDVRHLIIHNDSRIDDKFKKQDKETLIPLKGNKISLKYEITNRATTTIYELCRKIDSQLISKKLLPIRNQS